MHSNHPGLAPPELLLGTAMWGWTVPEQVCFSLLDSFYGAGFRGIDGATNYPINKIPADFRKSERILLQWIHAHGVNDLRITMKVGSLDNMRSPECNLSKSFLLFCLEEYGSLFAANLETLMVHWDNREIPEEIDQTLEGLAAVVAYGCHVGLSGIRNPEIYATRNELFGLDFKIQIKHNLLQSDYARYAPFHGKRRFFAYGMNAGGLKLDTTAYHDGSSLKARGGDTTNTAPLIAAIAAFLRDAPPLKHLSHTGLLYAYYHPDMAGMLLGVSSVEQLADSLDFYGVLRQTDCREQYLRLLTMQQDHAQPL
ncbi:MAG: aldo/keto reductase [Saprospiraceae bacterium]|nr:aldo/keto reductase [Saprospiraceae bacterium]